MGAVVVRHDTLLLVERGQEPDRGRWSVPGGRVRWGETMAEAAVRELQEETGLVGVCGPVLGWAERLSAAHHFVIVDFVVAVGPGTPRAGTDARRVAWAPVGELPRWPLVDGLLDFLGRHGVLGTPSPAGHAPPDADPGVR